MDCRKKPKEEWKYIRPDTPLFSSFNGEEAYKSIGTLYGIGLISAREYDMLRKRIEKWVNYWREIDDKKENK